MDIKNLSIKDILEEAVSSGTADLHLSVGSSPALKIKDDWLPTKGELITKEVMEKLVFSILNEKEKKKLDKNREIIITRSFGKNLRFKINIFYQRGFLSSTMRHLSDTILTIEQLGLNPIVKKLSEFNKGLIIVSGPFGSGRSTTIAAMIQEINKNRKEYIITIEDPIEYIFSNKMSIIEQREVGKDTRSFIDAVNYFQEENGDVLYVEDINDTKIIPKVLEIARGGALVLTSLTASSVSKTVSRILDNFQSFDQDRIRDLLSSSLGAILCQKVVPSIGGGMIVIQEILVVNDSIRSVIASGNVSQIDNIVQTSSKEGMISFDQVLADLVNKNRVSRQNALANCSSKELLQNLIRR